MARSRSVIVRLHPGYVENDWKQLFCEYLSCFHLRVYQLRLDIRVVCPEGFCPHDTACPSMSTLCLAYFLACISILSTALCSFIPWFLIHMHAWTLRISDARYSLDLPALE